MLRSGRQGTVDIGELFDYHDAPRVMRDRLLRKLTLETKKWMKTTPLSVREVSRLLSTSPAQLYRRLDDGECDKSMDQLVSLLQVLDAEIDPAVR